MEAKDKEQEKTPVTYRDVVRAPMVRRKPIEKRDPEKVVLVYPKDETQTDAEVAKKLLKSI